MTDLSGGRDLPWYLRFQLALQAQTAPNPSENGPFLFPEDPEEEVWVPIKLSQRQFTAIASAVDAGADIAYGADAIKVFWYLIRSIEHTMSMCDEVTTALLTCEDVQAALATLIATNPVVRDALRGFVTTDPAINEYVSNAAATVTTKILSQTELGRNILKPDQCDPDYVFNECSKLVSLLNSLTNDMFDAIEVGSNKLERGELMISAIPGVGIMPFDELLQLADDLVENISEDYNGAWDEGMYDDIRCGLFCTVKDSCEMSIDDAFAYYEGKATISLPANPVDALFGLLQFLDSGDFPGDLIVYGMHLLVLAAMRAGGDYLGIDFARLGLRITAAGDDPDNDWETLCEDCPPPPEQQLTLETHAGWEHWSPTFVEMDENGYEVWDITRTSNGGYATALIFDPHHSFKFMSEEFLSGTWTTQVAWTTYPGGVWNEDFSNHIPDDVEIQEFMRVVSGVMPDVWRVHLQYVGTH